MSVWGNLYIYGEIRIILLIPAPNLYSGREIRQALIICTLSLQGVFNLDAAVMKIKYLHSYTDLGKGTYRVRMLFHIPGTDLAEKNVKGCCEMDFDVIDD